MDCTTPERNLTVAVRWPGPRSYSHSSTTWQGTSVVAMGKEPGGDLPKYTEAQ
jgi:hypothetical protein